MRVAVEFALKAWVFGTNYEGRAYLAGRTDVHGNDSRPSKMATVGNRRDGGVKQTRPTGQIPGVFILIL